jgi:hypothetical protein
MIGTIFILNGLIGTQICANNSGTYAVPVGASDSSTTEASGRDIDEIRDRLATAIALGW